MESVSNSSFLSSNSGPILKMPHEITILFLSRLETPELLEKSLVCKQWTKVIFGSPFLKFKVILQFCKTLSFNIRLLPKFLNDLKTRTPENEVLFQQYQSFEAVKIEFLVDMAEEHIKNEEFDEATILTELIKNKLERRFACAKYFFDLVKKLTSEGKKKEVEKILASKEEWFKQELALTVLRCKIEGGDLSGAREFASKCGDRMQDVARKIIAKKLFAEGAIYEAKQLVGEIEGSRCKIEAQLAIKDFDGARNTFLSANRDDWSETAVTNFLNKMTKEPVISAIKAYVKKGDIATAISLLHEFNVETEFNYSSRGCQIIIGALFSKGNIVAAFELFRELRSYDSFEIPFPNPSCEVQSADLEKAEVIIEKLDNIDLKREFAWKKLIEIRLSQGLSTDEYIYIIKNKRVLAETLFMIAIHNFNQRSFAEANEVLDELEDIVKQNSHLVDIEYRIHRLKWEVLKHYLSFMQSFETSSPTIA